MNARRSSLWNTLCAVAAVGCLCVAALGLTATAPAHAQDQAAGQSGNWQSHKLTFNYVGISPTYSCVGLRDDMDFLLRQSGARVDSITPFSCENGGGVPSKLVSAWLKFSTLQPVADEAAQGQNDQGAWHHIEFSSTRSAPQLRGADCELVQEFQTQILPAFATRNVQARLPCVPHQTIGYQWALSFDVFVPNTAGGRAIGGAD